MRYYYACDDNDNLNHRIQVDGNEAWKTGMIAAGFNVIESDIFVEDLSTHTADGGVIVAITEADLLAAAQESAQGELLANVNQFIAEKPDGKTRYDQNLKLNLMQAAMDALAAGQPVPAPVTQVRAWISAVQSAYFERKQAIAAAADQTALEAVDISYGWFEALYGVAGTLQPDPDVYTSAIVS